MPSDKKSPDQASDGPFPHSDGSSADSHGPSSAEKSSRSSSVTSDNTSITETSAFGQDAEGPQFVPATTYGKSAENLLSKNKTKRTKLMVYDPTDPTHRQGEVRQGSDVFYTVHIRPSKSPNVDEVYVHNPTKTGEVYISKKWPGHSSLTDLGPAYGTDDQHSDGCRKRTREVGGQGRCYCSAPNPDKEI